MFSFSFGSFPSLNNEAFHLYSLYAPEITFLGYDHVTYQKPSRICPSGNISWLSFPALWCVNVDLSSVDALQVYNEQEIGKGLSPSECTRDLLLAVPIQRNWIRRHWNENIFGTRNSQIDLYHFFAGFKSFYTAAVVMIKVISFWNRKKNIQFNENRNCSNCAIYDGGFHVSYMCFYRVCVHFHKTSKEVQHLAQTWDCMNVITGLNTGIKKFLLNSAGNTKLLKKSYWQSFDGKKLHL